MQPALYDQLAQVEDDHWWHRARRQLIVRSLQRLHLPGAARIVDVGCGTGGSTAFLADFGHVTGVDSSAAALAHARRKRPELDFRNGDANRIDDYFEPQSIDLVTFLGVLYHRWIADDVEVLHRVGRILKPGGHVLLAEPAHKILTRRHDELDHGKTRYRLTDFKRMFTQSGLTYVQGRYFNTIAFPACLAMGLHYRWFGRRRAARSEAVGEVALPPRLVNRMLAGVMAVERRVLDVVPYPAGVSVLAVGRKGKA